MNISLWVVPVLFSVGVSKAIASYDRRSQSRQARRDSAECRSWATDRSLVDLDVDRDGITSTNGCP